MNREINTERDILLQMINHADRERGRASMGISEQSNRDCLYWNGQYEALTELKERCEELSRNNWEAYGERKMQA